MVIWASLIFTASTDTFSSEHTQAPIIELLRFLLPHAAESTLLVLHDLIRKCAHVGEYFIFGVLLFRAIRMPGQGWQWHWAFLALLIAALYASSDEIHQIFVPSRGASIFDALLDAGGASLAQLAAWIVNRRERRSSDREFSSRFS